MGFWISHNPINRKRNCALVSRNFTEYGWVLTKAPKGIVKSLQERLQHGLEEASNNSTNNSNISTTIAYESQDAFLETTLLPYFLQNEQMNQDILQYMHECQYTNHG